MKKMNKLKFLLFFLLLNVLNLTYAQNKTVKNITPYFEVFKPGLGTLTNGFVQDSDGFFWFGSNRGLVQWDGVTAKWFTDSNSILKGTGAINAIYEDPDRILWMGAQIGGLIKYNKLTNTFTSYTHNPDDPFSISSDDIGNLSTGQIITEDHDGFLWIGTPNGLNRFNKETEQFIHYVHNPADANSLISDEISAVLAASDGTLWIGTQAGLCHFFVKENVFRNYTYNPDIQGSISSNSIKAVFEDSKGFLWIGTSEGLNRFDPVNEEFIVYKNETDNNHSLTDNFVSDIEEDNNGLIWLTHYPASSGVSIFDPESNVCKNIKYDNTPNCIADNSGKGLYKDNAGTIWVISVTGALSKNIEAAGSFSSYSYDPDNPSGFTGKGIVGMIEDPDGELWVLSDEEDGLFRFNRNNNTFTNFPVNGKSLFSQGAWCEDGSFWIGDNVGTLYKLNFSTLEILKQYKITNAFITNISQDPYNPDILWLTTMLDGFVKVNCLTDEITYYKNNKDESTSISNNQIWSSVFQDDLHPELLWVGTAEGLNIFNKQTGRVEKIYMNDPNDPQSISSNIIMHIMQSKTGEYWIATFEGINKFDPENGTFESFSKSNGRFPANIIVAIFEDSAGILWISSVDEGNIIRFNPSNGEYKTYGKGDGVYYGTPFVVGRFQTSGGEIFFSGDDGFVIFDPSKVEDNNYKPPVFISNLTHGGESMELQSAPEHLETLVLDWQYPFFEFEISALNYTHPEKNRYRYKLEGWDKEWFEAGTDKKGRYSGLRSGEYTLKVTGSNNDGLWSDQTAELQIIVTTPFWSTLWFLGGLAVFITLSIASVVIFRIHAVKKRERVLEQKVLERTNELKIAKEKAETANRAKSIFLTNMSHELRTPLNAVLGFSEILDTRIKDPQNRRYLKSVQSSGISLLSLINDVLDLSRIEAGKMDLQYKAVSITELFNEINSIFLPRIKEQELEFRIEINNNIPEALVLDETKIRQVLINLMSNAVKFTEKGFIRLSAKAVKKNNSSSVDLIIEVEDTGKGIARKDHKRIFDAFEQASGQKTSRYGGTGLGLAITKNILNLMNGNVTLKSTPGKGTAFTVELKNVEIASGTAVSSVYESNFNTETIVFQPALILIADDIDYNRELLEAYLKPWEFSFLFADNGNMVIEKAEKNNPDLILLDMKMPELDGFETAGILKSRESTKNIPIIAVTASVLKQDEDEILKNCDSYLKKPLSSNVLITEIMKYLKYSEKNRQKTETLNTVHIIPQTDELKELYEISLDGNMDDIIIYLNELEKRNLQYMNFCNRIRELASGFEDVKIINLLEQYIYNQGRDNDAK